MKQTTLISIATLMTASLLLSGCGKSAQEEYSELCKKYEPYNAFMISGKFYNNVDEKVFYSSEVHSIIDKHKNYILEGEKIFIEMEKLAKSNPEIMKHFQTTYLWANNTPKEAKRLFSHNVGIHKKHHKGCAYNFQF